MKANFQKEWLQMDNYAFRILLVVLSKGGVFRGNLKAFQEELGINSKSQNAKIKEGISILAEEGIVLVLQQKSTYTLTLEEDAKAEKVKLDLNYLKMAEEMTKDKEIAANTFVKIWIACMFFSTKEKMTIAEVTELTGIQKRQIILGLQILRENGAIITKNTYEKVTLCEWQKTYFHRTGQSVLVPAWFDETGTDAAGN